jgi:diadenosine tetraphosphate (Ap4A) HIT family hydrolase
MKESSGITGGKTMATMNSGGKSAGFEVDAEMAKECFTLGDLPLCRVLLKDDSNYPWFVLMPRRAGVREFYELDDEDIAQFWRESNALGRLLMQHLRGYKLNVAALGNVVAQLHVHHIVRRTSDPAWPKPVWGAVPAIPYAKGKADVLVAEIQTLLKQSGLKTC